MKLLAKPAFGPQALVYKVTRYQIRDRELQLRLAELAAAIFQWLPPGSERSQL